MATKSKLAGMHTAGIFSDMTVDGPNIGTLVVIMDRAKNLPNRRSMGKQDPYCAARLGKEAKKTNTDKRGGQTPRWDQELRFTVHDSADYHQLKVSVFNDDKKTELIGETWVSLESVLLPGGGQSDGWHGLNCKGKYAGEIRIELTYYDIRPKAEKAPAERKPTSMRPEGGSPAVGGPRESTPVKRRPLPSDPTGASPSPVATPEHRGLSGPQSGPRSYPPPQRTAENTPTHQRRTQHPDAQAQRRPLPDAAPMNGTPGSNNHTPQHQRAHQEYNNRSPSPQPPISNASAPQYHDPAFDMSYTAPKAYELPSVEQGPQFSNELVSRPISHNDLRSSHGHAPNHPDMPHSHSAPLVPTQHTDMYHGSAAPRHDSYHQPQSVYQEPSYHIEPLRLSRSNTYDQIPPHDTYQEPQGHGGSQASYDPLMSHGRSPGALQPTVEDEDDMPPPPPVHRSSTASVIQHQQQALQYHNDAPAPLNITRYREESPRAAYDHPSQSQSYGMNEYSTPSSERRYTHPRASPNPGSRPVSRDAIVPSPLRNETAMIPSSLIAGFDPSRHDNRMSIRGDIRDYGTYQTPPSYETPPRSRQLSETEYHTPQYESPSQSYYPHTAPEEPRHTSPVHDTAIVKPRAMSPGDTRNPVDNRASRPPNRSMPTRKSVSPRPPPPEADMGERRLSGVPFNPDSFDVLNPALAKKSPTPIAASEDDPRPEVNDKGQIVTFSGRVIDASDHLPLDSWAPEPERKGDQKDRPVRTRPALSGARDIEAAKQRERDYRRDRMDRDRIRNAVNVTHGETGSPSNALVTTRHNYSSSSGSPMNAGTVAPLDYDSTPPGSGGRNRLQKRNQRPVSSFIPSSNNSPSPIPMPTSNVLRERENIGGYGGSPSYGASSRHSVAAPPIPAKIPLDHGIPPSEDMTALSLELQSIDIGPGSGGRQRGTARRRYGGYA